jgi:2-iminobutanoate/2-iminopropanoate deaminase
MKNVVESKKAPAPIGPYSQAIWANDILFVSGQVAIDRENGAMITNEIKEETHQVMKNLGNILEEAGLNFENVVKCSIFVKDMGNFQAINEAYGSYFGVIPPARETVEVSALPKNANVEISCIAIK